MDKAVKRVRYLVVIYNDDPDAAHAGTALVGRLEIYCRKVLHSVWRFRICQFIFMQKYQYNSLYRGRGKEISPLFHIPPYGGRLLQAIYHCAKQKP